MGGLGKGAKVDTKAMANTMERMNQQQATRERLKKKMEMKQQQKLAEALKAQQDQFQREQLQNEMRAAYSLQPNVNNPNNMVFRLEGAEAQEKSFIHPDLLAEMEAGKAGKPKVSPAPPSSKKGKKKGKK